MRELHESGHLSHLYGRPLELEDDPEWLVTKVLKQAGYSHPLLEQSKDVTKPLEAAEERIFRLERRRDWLAGPESGCTPQEAELFNQARQRALDTYRDDIE